jgi:hypothetical protein
MYDVRAMRRCDFILPLLVVIIVGVGSFPPSTMAADDALNGPWRNSPDWKLAQKPGQKPHTHSKPSGVFPALLTFFSKVISPVDGSRCPSYPTCAAYSKQAYQKHGTIVGTLMTVDRLIHEASEARFSPEVDVYGVRRIYDPVSANEFWKKERNIHAAR